MRLLLFAKRIFLTWYKSIIKNVYNKATSAVLFNSSNGHWFRTTVESDRDVFFHPPSSTFLKRIMTDALEDHEGIVSIGGRTITNLRFADDIDGLAGEEEELANLVERLDKPPQPTAWRSVPRRPSWWQKHQWHQYREQSKWTEAWDSHKLQVPGLSYNW